MINIQSLLLLGKFVTMTFIYADVIRDSMLFSSLISLISLKSWLNYSFIFEFPHQILWLLLLSILLPIFATAVKVGKNGLEMVFGYNAPRWNTCLSLPIAVIFCPAIPALLVNIRDIEKQKTKLVLENQMDLPTTLEESHQRVLL